MSSVAEALPEPRPVSAPIPWVTLGVIFGLLVACYLPVLNGLVKQWNNDEDMGHGFFVPVIAAVIAWQKRGELAAIPAKSNWLGLVLVAWGALQLTIATLGAELFLQRTAFVLAVIGSVWFLTGTAYLRALWFPLLLLFFMVPLPAIIYNQITFPLQLLASRVAETTLMLIGIPVLREGNILELAGQRLQVVEACSGIRSLLSLTFLSLVYGYFFEKMTWLRVVLFLSTIPVALITNSGRVTLTGILWEINPEYAQGFFHSATGWVIFVAALVMLVAIHQALYRFHRYIYAKQ